MKKLILSIGAIALLTTGLHANQFPKGSYESEMLLTVEGMKKHTYAENLRLCRIFAEKSKEHDLTNKNAMKVATVENCRKKIVTYCGALSDSQVASK